MKKLLTPQSFLVLLILAIIFGAVIYFLPSKDRTLINNVSIIASGVTMLGLIVTLKQVIEVGTIASQTEIEVKRKLENFNQILFLSEISTVNALINEVSTYLRSDKYELGIIKLKDIKRVLNIIQNNHEKLQLKVDEVKLRALIANITIDADSIEKRISSAKNQIKIPEIIRNLDQTSDFLHSIHSQIKVI